jgi:hypothetical protein
MNARAAVANCQDSLKVGLSGLVDWGQSGLPIVLKEAPIRSIPGCGLQRVSTQWIFVGLYVSVVICQAYVLAGGGRYLIRLEAEPGGRKALHSHVGFCLLLGVRV